jgi:hypothetical protein
MFDQLRSLGASIRVPPVLIDVYVDLVSSAKQFAQKLAQRLARPGR